MSFDLNLLRKGAQLRNIHNPDLVVFFERMEQVGDSIVYIFSNTKEQEIRMDKNTLNNYVLVLGLVSD